MRNVQRQNVSVRPGDVGRSVIVANAKFNRAPKGSASPRRSRVSLRDAVNKLLKKALGWLGSIAGSFQPPVENAGIAIVFCRKKN